MNWREYYIVVYFDQRFVILTFLLPFDVLVPFLLYIALTFSLFICLVFTYMVSFFFNLFMYIYMLIIVVGQTYHTIRQVNAGKTFLEDQILSRGIR